MVEDAGCISVYWYEYDAIDLNGSKTFADDDWLRT